MCRGAYVVVPARSASCSVREQSVEAWISFSLVTNRRKNALTVFAYIDAQLALQKVFRSNGHAGQRGRSASLCRFPRRTSPSSGRTDAGPGHGLDGIGRHATSGIYTGFVFSQMEQLTKNSKPKFRNVGLGHG